MSRKPRVAINGFGRIGRSVLRAGYGKVDFVGVNHLMGNKAAAHLLKWDSVHGKADFAVQSNDNEIIAGNDSIKTSHTRDPKEIPFAEWEADVVFDCTGAFKTKEQLNQYSQAGVNKVLVSAPAPGADLTIVYGVNHKQYDPSKHHVVSNASCTTNCLAPLAQSLNAAFGIEKALMTTVHSYTNDQCVLDGNHKDLRRSRTAGVSMIPTTTGAAKTVGKILPELDGKIDGLAVRVPTPNVSLVDLTWITKKTCTADEVKAVLKEDSQNLFKGIMAYEEEPLVSVDFMSRSESSIIDAATISVMGGNMIKVLAWYDNEMGFSSRMIDFVNYISS